MTWHLFLIVLFSFLPLHVVSAYALTLRRDARSLGMCIDNLREEAFQRERIIENFRELTTPIVQKVFQSGEISEWSEANDTSASVTWAEVFDLNELLASIEE